MTFGSVTVPLPLPTPLIRDNRQLPPTRFRTNAPRIREFRDEYRFLSNFYPSPVHYGGMNFNTVEAAYQASKTLNQRDRLHIASLPTPAMCKEYGKKLTIRNGWEALKITTMQELIRKKFAPGTPLAYCLMNTDDAELIEGNRWGDLFWGVDLDTGEGENHLGILLMEQRLMLQRLAGEDEHDKGQTDEHR